MDGKTYESLTPMERNCLRLARHDCKAEQIAHELGISASTVNTHVFNARRKLGGPSRLTAADMLRAYEARFDARRVELPTDAPHKPTVIGPAASADSGTDPTVKEQNMEPDPTHGMIAPPPWISRQPQWMAPPTSGSAGDVHPADVREVRTAFAFDDDVLAPHGRKDDRSDETLRRIALVLAIATLVAIVAIAAPAIYDSAAMRIANSLERPQAT